MYGETKNLILRTFEVRADSLHFILGLSFFLLCFAVTRRPWLSLWFLLTVQLTNEGIDLHEDHAAGRALGIDELLLDTAITMAVPTAIAACLAAIMVVARAVRR